MSVRTVLSFSTSQVFRSDVENLLSMADMWRSREPPTPLDFDGIRQGTFSVKKTPQVNGNGLTTNGHHANGSAPKATGSSATEQLLNGASSSSTSAAALKDQRTLSLEDNVELFVGRYANMISCSSSNPDGVSSSLNRLAARISSGQEDTIFFDKDDEDTLDFVTASANLRSTAYGIATKSRWEVKGPSVHLSIPHDTSYSTACPNHLQRWRVTLFQPLRRQMRLFPGSLSCKPFISCGSRTTRYETFMSNSDPTCPSVLSR